MSHFRSALVALAIGSLPIFTAFGGGLSIKDTPYYNLSTGGWGMDSDRVSLWPLAYFDSKSTSIIWPLFSASDDYVGVCPLYSQRGAHGVDEFSILWPLFQCDLTRGSSYAFPLYVANREEFVSLLFYHLNHDGQAEEGLLAGLIGWTRDNGGLNSSWTFPLYYADDASFYSVPFSCNQKGWFACTFLAGCTEQTSWLLPLYAKDQNWFHTLPLSCSISEPGKFFSLPLLSRFDSNSARILLGLGGWDDGSSWAIPLYYYNSGDFLSLPYSQFGRGWAAGLGLAGCYDDTNWLLPLYLKTDNWFHTLVLSCQLDEPYNMLSLPLLSAADRESGILLGGLAGWTENCSWALPLYIKTDRWLHTPLLSWTLDDSQRFFSLPMLSWSEQDDITLLMGLAGVRKDSSWIAPLYYADSQSFMSLLYCQIPTGWTAGLGLAGHMDNSSWLLPVYINTGTWLHTPLLSWSTDDARRFFSLPLLSWASQDSATFLMGLAGARTDCNWTFPLYYWDDDGLLTLPFAYWKTGWAAGCGLIGANNDTSWLLPLYLKDKESFISPFYCQHHSSIKDYDSACLPWLLSGMTWYDNGETKSWSFLLFLAGMDSKTSYEQWVLPFYTYTSDPTFDDLYCQVDAAKLPDGLKYRNYEIDDGNGKKNVSRPETGNSADRKLSTLLVQHKEQVSTAYSGKQRQWYHVKDHNVWSSYFFLWHNVQSDEYVYDVKAKNRVGERNESSIRLLTLLYASSEKTDTMKKTHSSDSSILWRLWKRTEKDGDVSTDIFPGISHDTRKDGYSKTSFLWKLFCYENDPRTGSHLDLFFIPLK